MALYRGEDIMSVMRDLAACGNFLSMSLLIASLVPVTGCGSDDFEQHFSRPLPGGTQLLNSEKRRAGFDDLTYGYEFSVPDDGLKNQLIDEWQLRVSDSPGRNVDLDKLALPWWPSPDERSRMQAFVWEDENKAKYKCMWYSPEKHRLYLQLGNW